MVEEESHLLEEVDRQVIVVEVSRQMNLDVERSVRLIQADLVVLAV